MLQVMREKMQGIIAGIIVALIAVTFALWGIQYYSHGLTETGVIAKVNGEKITEQQVRRIYSRVQQQNLMTLGKDYFLDQKAQVDLKEKIIQQTIKNKVLTGFADELDLYISKEQLQATIMGLPIFQAEGGFSKAKFQQMLSNFFYSEQDFAQELQSFLLISHLELGVEHSAFVLPDEMDTAIKLIKQTRDFSYCVISPQDLANKTAVTEKEIKDYYEQHKNEFTTPEKISIEYVELNAATLKSKINSDDDAKLKQFYKEHTELFAKDMHSSSSTRTNAGVASATDAVLPPFEQLRSKVKIAYERYMLQQLLVEENDKLTDLTYTNSNSLEPAANALGLPIKTTGLFVNKNDYANAHNAKSKSDTRSNSNGKNRNEKERSNSSAAANTATIAAITANPKVIKAAFSESVLKQGYNSNPIEIADNDIVVLRIKQHIAETALPLSQVQNEIIALVKQKNGHALAKTRGEELLQVRQKKGEKDAQALSSKYNLVWQNVTKVARSENKYDKRILDAVFSLARPALAANSTTPAALPTVTASQQKNSPPVALIDLQDKGYVLLQLNKVYDGNIKNVTPQEQKAIHDALQSSSSKFDYDLLVSDAMQRAKVKRQEAAAPVSVDYDQ